MFDASTRRPVDVYNEFSKAPGVNWKRSAKDGVLTMEFDSPDWHFTGSAVADNKSIAATWTQAFWSYNHPAPS
jgi:hypothetical protein